MSDLRISLSKFAHRADDSGRSDENRDYADPHNFHCPSQPSSDDHAAWTMAQARALVAARNEYKNRRQREKVFGRNLFGDPVWDMLLDLFIAASEGRRESVSSTCIAAAVPATTALRYLAQMVKLGLVRRTPHPTDARCNYLELTKPGYDKMLSYFAVVS
jgi:hypothetical protein